MDGSEPTGLIRLRRGNVVDIRAERQGFVELTVLVGPEGTMSQALAYPDLTGPVAPGDAVMLNTTAAHLGLGTGGFDLVVAVEGGAAVDVAHEGRVMKVRYTPVQAAVFAVEETHRDALEASDGLAGEPVVAAPLHSMIAPIAAGAKASGNVRVVYV
ncbi:MAG: DUF3866 family protein, partial [Actinomycetota bacterium]